MFLFLDFVVVRNLYFVGVVAVVVVPLFLSLSFIRTTTIPYYTYTARICGGMLQLILMIIPPSSRHLSKIICMWNDNKKSNGNNNNNNNKIPLILCGNRRKKKRTLQYVRAGKVFVVRVI